MNASVRHQNNAYLTRPDRRSLRVAAYQPRGSTTAKRQRWILVRNSAVRALAAALLVSLFLANCGQANAPSGQPGREPVAGPTLTKADSGKTVAVGKGDIVTIVLEDNPTTGYRWAVDKNDSSTLALKSDDYVQSPSSGVGGGGQRTFKFEALQAGTVQLQLKRWREWEGDTSIVERFNTTIQVR